MIRVPWIIRSKLKNFLGICRHLDFMRLFVALIRVSILSNGNLCSLTIRIQDKTYGFGQIPFLKWLHDQGFDTDFLNF
jgi:hypothetical protein